MKPPLKLGTEQALELGLINKDQLWHNGQAYLGNSGRSYKDYVKDGGPEISKEDAVDFGLCSRHQLWFEGEAFGPKGPYEIFLNQVQNGKLQFKSLDFAGEDLTSLPAAGLKVDGDLRLYGCESLESLPSGLKVDGDLILGDCTSLESLPPDLKVGGKMDLTGCRSLESLPLGLKVGGNLHLRGCESLKSPIF
jgi:hypothetical protein